MFFTVFIVIAFELIVISNTQNRNQCLNNHKYDYLLLSIQWPTSYCYQKRECNERNHDNKWQIHGLWPQFRDGLWPQYCCSDQEYDTSVIEPIMRKLLKSWKSLSIDGNDESFWRHEWTKHGTCAISSPQLRGMFQYFSRTLKIFNSLQINSMLKKGGIIPSNDRIYSLEEIHRAIELGLNSKARLECSKIEDPVPILSEIYFCLDKNTLQLIDCVHEDDHQCGRSQVRFPFD